MDLSKLKPLATIYVRTEDEAILAKRAHPRALVYVLPADLFETMLLGCKLAEQSKYAKRGRRGEPSPIMTKERYAEAKSALAKLAQVEAILGSISAADLSELMRALRGEKLNASS